MMILIALLFSMTAFAESPPCDCEGVPLLTGAPECVEAEEYNTCFLGDADVLIVNNCDSPIVLEDFPTSDERNGFCNEEDGSCELLPGEEAGVINTIGTYTMTYNGETYTVEMNKDCDPSTYTGGDSGGGPDSAGCSSMPASSAAGLLGMMAATLLGLRRRD